MTLRPFTPHPPHRLQWRPETTDTTPLARLHDLFVYALASEGMAKDRDSRVKFSLIRQELDQICRDLAHESPDAGKPGRGAPLGGVASHANGGGDDHRSREDGPVVAATAPAAWWRRRR